MNSSVIEVINAFGVYLKCSSFLVDKDFSVFSHRKSCGAQMLFDLSWLVHGQLRSIFNVYLCVCMVEAYDFDCVSETVAHGVDR